MNRQSLFNIRPARLGSSWVWCMRAAAARAFASGRAANLVRDEATVCQKLVETGAV